MRVLLPYHLGSGNRGCEGIVRGISKLLNLNKTQLVLFDISSYDYNKDVDLGLNEIAELKYTKQDKKIEVMRLVCRILQKMKIPYFYNQLMSSYYVNSAKMGDIIIITGGDIYCYEGAAALPNMIASKAKKRGIKIILFGASMEKKFLDKKTVEGLKNYDLITTRETISAKTMDDLCLKNYIYPDPAFSLEPVPCSLPNFFIKTIVGINLSPFIDTDGLLEENMDNVIKHILSEDMEICFIPHVFWKEQDDRISIMKYIKKYGDRVHILDSEKMSYLQIRYAISKCKYFIGGRTHSVISAYSTRVPCIALGYSVKARGIACDIGMPDYTVVDSKHLKGEMDILNALLKIEENYEQIIQVYKGMDDYIRKQTGLKELILG